MTADEAAQPDAARQLRFVSLYERHYQRVVRYARRRVTPDQAEDIAHEAFTVAWRRLEEIPAAGELPWLLRVAHNVIRSSARKAHRDSSILSSLTGTSGTGTTEPDHAETTSARHVALAALPWDASATGSS